MRRYIFPYHRYSQSARELARALGVRRIRREGSRFRGSLRKEVINWGSRTLPEEVLKCNVRNSPHLVAACSNKLEFFSRFVDDDQSIIPEWTSDRNIALDWVANGEVLFARTILNGHSGQGIVEIENEEEFVEAPLYVKYVKKSEEYRVHMAFGQIIDIQRKVISNEKKNSGDEINWRVRNHGNGFIFQRGGINPPECVEDVANRAFRLIGLDFGALDVIYNRYRDQAYVLEMNTAPGLSGQTINSYVEAFRGN